MYNFDPYNVLLSIATNIRVTYDCFCAPGSRIPWESNPQVLVLVSTSTFNHENTITLFVVNLKTHRYSQFAGLYWFPLRMKQTELRREWMLCSLKHLCLCRCVFDWPTADPHNVRRPPTTHVSSPAYWALKHTEWFKDDILCPFLQYVI